MFYKQTETSLNLTTLLTHNLSEVRLIAKLIVSFQKEQQIKQIKWNLGNYFEIPLKQGTLVIDLSDLNEEVLLYFKYSQTIAIDLTTLTKILENQN